ncbi:MAG TPA: filamentous hemagglutinin N-terminal domain-containing protein, partial [Acetobacteraceae bacterium]|nr:filamentous hemagglutinin N-terminal domain-containing protein [Acetobacteraceae bacterium]
MREATRDRPLRASQIDAGRAAPRRVLLRSSALQAVAVLGLSAVSGAALAQSMPTQSMPAPNQLPTGGQVFSGTAGIAASGSTLNVNQASQRAGINWQSFSIGSQATVAIHTPGARSLTINRVVGPNPSVIAGRLSSNGQVVITNQSGVTFTQGAQVDVQSLIASAPGISEANARAGRLVFDQPARPGAGVANHGTITVGQTGLAALVAPQVANSGVIRAQMGRVVLAGAAAHTVDLYGDGLLSIDVSKQVTTVPVGPDGKPATALVTNTGTILADGGSIVLTAKAVDGLVTTLVDAGGTVSAASKAGTPGRIVIGGTGGDVILRGMVAAKGDAAGARGGQIEVNAPGHVVALADGARVDASGRAGGGVVAVGTTLARATGGPSVSAPTAKRVTIASDAAIAADATANGDGGIVTVLSQGGATLFGGEISAAGGPGGGNGGAVEVSGDYLALQGSVNVLAPIGAAGSVLLDPGDILIVTDGTAPSISPSNPIDAQTGTTTLDYTQINKLSGNVTLQATGSIDMTGAMDLTGKDANNKAPHIDGLAMLANGNITIGAALTGKSGIILSAGANITIGKVSSPGTADAGLTINAPVVSTKGGTIALGAGTGGIAINSTVSTVGGTVNLLSTGGVAETGAGKVVADTLIGTVAGNAQLSASANNAIATLGDFAVTGGTLALKDSVALAMAGTASGTDVVLSASTLNITGTVDASGTASLTATPGTIGITGTVSGTTAVMLSGAAGITETGVLIAGTLSGDSSAGGASLTGAAVTENNIGELGDFTTKQDFVLHDATVLHVTGTVSAPNVTLVSVVGETSMIVSGTVLASGTASLETTTGAMNITSTGTVSGSDAVVLQAAQL